MSLRGWNLILSQSLCLHLGQQDCIHCGFSLRPATFILDLFTYESCNKKLEMSKCTFFFFVSYINFRVRFILPAVPVMVTDGEG